MRSYPIWNNVTACIYGSGKSFGAKDTSEMEVLVGSSPKNSHTHCKIVTTKREMNHEKYGDVVIFKTSVDDVILKETIFKNNKGKAGEYITQRTKLKSIKSL
jgi:hypothetical protein